MKILLTGGSGFIGRNLLESLREKYSVLSPTHKQLDLLDWRKVEQYIKKNKIKVIIHSAVEGGDNELEKILRMFISIYRNIGYIDKLINIGSGAVYGKTRQLKKVRETEIGKFLPTDNYGLGKLICGQLAKGNKKLVTVHPFGIYGKYEDYRFKFISNSIVKNLLGLPFRIKQNVIFDYLYIDDFVDVVEFFINHHQFIGDYNLTSTQSISLIRICQIINKISTKPTPINVINKNLNYQYTGSNKKLRAVFPNFKPISYIKGISSLYRYYQTNLASLDKTAIIKDEYFYRSKIKK